MKGPARPMPKIEKSAPRIIRHANADRMNYELSRFVQGTWHSSVIAATVVRTVACAKCRAAAGWPCTSLTTATPTGTPHSIRWSAYQEQRNNG